MSDPTGEPIQVRCEGSGCSPCIRSVRTGMCSTCGQWRRLAKSVMPEHTRDDIVARTKRGDFG